MAHPHPPLTCPYCRTPAARVDHPAGVLWRCPCGWTLLARPAEPEENAVALLVLILLILAFGAFVTAALGVVVSRVNLVALGLALWVLTAVIAAWPGA